MVYSTALTITQPPEGASYAQATPFTFSGRLVFYEGTTPYGLDGMSIALSYGPSANPEQYALGAATTAGGGYYTKSVAIPTAGAWTLKAKFAGVTGLSASEAYLNLNMWAEVTEFPWLLVGLGGLLILLVAGEEKKRKRAGSR